MREESLAAHVLMIAYHFSPESVSGTHRSLHFARSLEDAGYGVGVVTVSSESVKLIDEALNEVFPFSDRIMRVSPRRTAGQRYVALAQRVRGQSVQRERPERDYAYDGGLAPNRSRSFGRWVRRHLVSWDEFPDSHRGWYGPAIRTALRYARSKQIAAVFASGPPWTGVLVARKVARRLGARLIVDFRDPWTASIGEYVPYRTRQCHSFAQYLERRVIESASLVIFNTPQMMATARRAFAHVEPKKFLTILNGTDVPRRTLAEAFPRQGPIYIRHFGTLYRGRSISPLVGALERLVEAGVVEPQEILVELIGHSTNEFATTRSDGHEDSVQIRMVPQMPFSEAIDQMITPSLLVVVQPPHLKPQIPTKLYDYLCTGNPLLVLAPEDSATWSLAKSYSRSWRLDPDDIQKNADIVAKLISDWRSGRLLQERTLEDTASLTKTSLGRDFVEAVSRALKLAPPAS